MARSEEQDKDQTDSGPNISVLNDRYDVGVRYCCESEDPNEDGDGDEDSGVIDRSLNLRIVALREVPDQPAVYTLCRLRSHEIHSDRLAVDFCVWSSGSREQKQDRCGSKLKLRTVNACP